MLETFERILSKTQRLLLPRSLESKSTAVRTPFAHLYSPQAGANTLFKVIK